MLIKITKALFALSIIIIVGCTTRPDRQMLVGKYCFNREGNRDSLFVNLDGTYSHTYSSSSGRLFEQAGTWKYDSMNQEVLFEQFVFFNDRGADGFPPGNWYSRIRAIDSVEIRLMYSAESDIYYFKKY